MTRARSFAIAALVAALTIAAAPVAFPGGAQRGADPRPNLILITSDDQWISSMDENPMPRTERLLGEQGSTFTQAILTSPLCCPARAGWITGQYAHNNGVTANAPGYAGLIEPGNVLPVWLRRAGYRTIHIGKWLNRYGAGAANLADVPPGWSEWHSVVTAIPRQISYYDYPLRENGRTHRFGHKPDDYLGRVLANRTTEMLRTYLPRDRPLFLELDHYAPHGDPGGSHHCRNAAVPDRRDLHLFDDRELPKPASYNEEDVSDKSDLVKLDPLLTPQQEAILTRRYRCGLAALRSVDRSVARIVRVLNRFGELDNTVIAFSSDNGYQFGTHRILGKAVPYEESVRTPFLVRVPQALRPEVPDGITIDEPVANIDIAPTFLELAQAAPCGRDGCRTLDGRSFLPLLRQEPGYPPDRALAVELKFQETGEPAGEKRICSFQGFRTPETSLSENYVTQTPGEPCPAEPQIEAYDLVGDPLQLENSWDGLSAPEQDALLGRAESLRDCAGIEGRDPLPPSGHWCE